MPHQRAAVEKIRASRTRVGAFFMEPGTGKTAALIALAHLRRTRFNRLVWFCPVSLKATARAEWLRHTDLSDADVYVFDDMTHEETIPRTALVFIVGIESMSSSARVVLAVRSLITTETFVVVDESGYIKTPAALRTERIRVVSKHCRYRHILTGTPVTQGVQDLYAQMRFLDPDILGYRSFYSFSRNHLEYHPDRPDLVVRTHNVGHLAARIAPYVYQVTKDECLDLPEKLYEYHTIDLTCAQREAYQRAKDEFLSIERDEVRDYDLFRLFTALQQIVCGFWKRNGTYLIYDHERLKILDTILTTIPDDARVIIWTKYHFCVQGILAHLQQHYGAECAVPFFGLVRPSEREATLVRFREGAVRFLVATPATGGHGLTLNEAAHVVFYTNSFNYAERVQAEDRCHRIGQTHTVTYYDIIATRTIDERIQDALVRKENVLDAFRRKVEQVKDASRAEVRIMRKELVQTL